MRARHQPEQASIPTPTPIPTPIHTMIGRIGRSTDRTDRQPLPGGDVILGGLRPVVVRKGRWRSKIGVGVAIGIGIESTRDGIRIRETGYCNRIVAVLTQFGGEFELSMRASTNQNRHRFRPRFTDRTDRRIDGSATIAWRRRHFGRTASVRKGRWRSKIGVGVGIGIGMESTRMGFDTRNGTATVLLRC